MRRRGVRLIALIHDRVRSLSDGPTLARALVENDSARCIDCIARRAWVSIETLMVGLLRMQRVVRVKSAIGRCPLCGI